MVGQFPGAGERSGAGGGAGRGGRARGQGAGLGAGPARHHVPGLRGRVLTGDQAPPLPRLREGGLLRLLGQQGAHQVQAVRGGPLLQLLLRHTLTKYGPHLIKTNANRIAEYGGEPELAGRFKRKGSHTVGRYIPQRLKLSANAEGCQMSGYLKQKVNK